MPVALLIVAAIACFAGVPHLPLPISPMLHMMLWLFPSAGFAIGGAWLVERTINAKA